MKLKEFRDCVEKLQRHDLSALERIYREYFNKIYVSAFGKVRNEQDAYDIAMDVIVRLTRYTGDANEIRNHVGLLIAMTNNAVKDFYRRQRFVFALEDGERLQSVGTGDMLWINDIMQCLTEEEQSIFIGHVLWGRSLKEIAEENGKSYISVRRTYKEIKKKIKEIYKE